MGCFPSFPKYSYLPLKQVGKSSANLHFFLPYSNSQQVARVLPCVFHAASDLFSPFILSLFLKIFFSWFPFLQCAPILLFIRKAVTECSLCPEPGRARTAAIPSCPWGRPPGQMAAQSRIYREETGGLCRKGWQLDTAEAPVPAIRSHLVAAVSFLTALIS